MDGWIGGWVDGWVDEQNHSECVTKQWKENGACVCEGRGGGSNLPVPAVDGWMDEQNHSERVTKQWKENVVCVYEEGRGGGIRT